MEETQKVKRSLIKEYPILMKIILGLVSIAFISGILLLLASYNVIFNTLLSTFYAIMFICIGVGITLYIIIFIREFTHYNTKGITFLDVLKGESSKDPRANHPGLIITVIIALIISFLCVILLKLEIFPTQEQSIISNIGTVGVMSASVIIIYLNYIYFKSKNSG